MAIVPTFGIFFGGFNSGGVPSTGVVENKLLSDLEGDWQFLDGIEDVGFRFGPQRTFRESPPPTAPTAGIKVFRCNPSQKDIMIAAANGGFESSDMVFVCWAQTLSDDDTPIEPKIGDFFLSDEEWRIRTVKRTADYAQWRCLVRKSVK